ncbi:hypothetical protein [Solwaraspora sp. WMMD792]|uniref:hypothetical protein n=1 Tax=Solwaraspora sp. WMMD792 TaxID=3016099 RepID=UPI002416B12A|nr:hypothetical protein [Solwaraspora sp. WMMD792]MDG4768746.1 hypothetical protein [Solwaraspora sp. WMMD792]MDG4768785.1 hypothetical protein [Solwaraspora sp. WMMD792]MDG4768825.1 hypothetical protein [Solwaraspora sp. WMMD792]MDG4768859.1 hypothetical protein [Solwaraspora sp. WMMD792]MDG4768892.1 hypothetical protein [Solwaraspora sp. WMMD792]
MEHESTENQPDTVPTRSDICGQPAVNTVVATTNDDSGQPTPIRPGVIRTGAYAGTVSTCDAHVDQATAGLRAAGLVVDVFAPIIPTAAVCGEIWRVAADSVLTPDGGPEHQALQRAAAGTGPGPETAPVDPTPDPDPAGDAGGHGVAGGWSGPAGCGARCLCGLAVDGFDSMAPALALLDEHIAGATTADSPEDVPVSPAADVAVDVVQRCGRPAVAGVATQPHPLRWTGPRTYAGTIWVCAGHEDVVTEQARTGGLDTGLVGAPERVRCGEISAEGVDLADVPAGAWPRLAVLAAANVTAVDAGRAPDDAIPSVRATELRPGMWVATGRDDVPGVEVRAVEVGAAGLVGVLLAGPEYAEHHADDLVPLVDEETVAAAAEALRVRTRRQLMLDGLRALVAAAERDPSILPVDRLQVTGRAANLAGLQAFAAELGSDVVPVGERLVAELLTGGGPADDLGGSSAPLSIEMYVYNDADPADQPAPPARGTAAVVVPAQPTGGDL